MNAEHRELLASDGWREVLENWALPFAFEGRAVTDLGDDVLEVGPGPGLTTDLLHDQMAHLTAVELDEELARNLRARLTGTNVDVVHADATSMPFEDGRFTGAVLFTMMHHVPTVELQDELFGEVRRVLAPGALMVASDSIASDDLAALHVDDVYNPVDPEELANRLTSVGFAEIEVRTNPFAWAVHATAPGRS